MSWSGRRPSAAELLIETNDCFEVLGNVCFPSFTVDMMSTSMSTSSLVSRMSGLLKSRRVLMFVDFGCVTVASVCRVVFIARSSISDCTSMALAEPGSGSLSASIDCKRMSQTSSCCKISTDEVLRNWNPVLLLQTLFREAVRTGIRR